MEKELRDGGEQDTWAGEGAEALARNLLVDGETGESFPAQVPSPLLTGLSFCPYFPSLTQTRLEFFQKLPLEKTGCGVDLNFCFVLGSVSHSG